MADIGGELAAHRLVVLAQLAVGLDRPRQRDQLLIGDIGLDRVEMLGQMVDGLHHAAGQPPAEQRGRQQDQHDRRAEQRQRVSAQAPDVRNVLAHAQHLRPVRCVDAQRVVVGLGLHRLALAGHAGAALLHRLAELRPVGVVGQVGVHDGMERIGAVVDKRRGLAVKKHGAVRIDQCKAQGAGALLRQHGCKGQGIVGVLRLVGGGVSVADLGNVAVHPLHIAALEQQRGGGQHRQHAEHAGQDQAAAVAAGHAQRLLLGVFVSHRCPPC